MLKTLRARFQQGHRTIPFPLGEVTMPDRFRGLPHVDAGRCPDGCRECAEACPTDAIKINGSVRVDLGRCLFCTDCMDACPEGAISYTQDYRLATRTREDLMFPAQTGARALQLATALEGKARKLFGRSLKLREVSAAGCNGCEADVNVLNTIVFDLGRFGVQFVASPRHADGVLITGPVSKNMELGLRKTYEAVPSPKIVIAVGACAISGGPFLDHSEVRNGGSSIVPVDLYIPGCPPHPLTILDGLLRLLGRIETEQAAARPTEVVEINRRLSTDPRHGPEPEVLFITCADAFAAPSTITEGGHGEALVCSSLGSIVPPFEEMTGSMASSIEYALAAGVRRIVVMGHYGCGAMKTLLDPQGASSAGSAWLRNARKAVDGAVKGLPGAAEDVLLRAVTEENVRVQLEHLRTHPSIARLLAGKQLVLDGWIYDHATGKISTWNPAQRRFLPLDETGR